MADVIELELRRPAAPALSHVEIRLLGEGDGLEMVLFDDRGAVAAVLEYSLASKPEGFDLDVLRTAWDQWKGQSAIAS